MPVILALREEGVWDYQKRESLRHLQGTFVVNFRVCENSQRTPGHHHFLQQNLTDRNVNKALIKLTLGFFVILVVGYFRSHIDLVALEHPYFHLLRKHLHLDEHASCMKTTVLCTKTEC